MKISNAGYLRTLPGLVTILSISSLLVLSSASGELLFSDSFRYPAGDLDGQGPPPGSPPGQGGWVRNNHNPRVATFGLNFPGILTGGNCARLNSVDDAVSDEAIAAIGPVTPDVDIVWVGFSYARSVAAVRERRLRGGRSYRSEHHRSQRRHWHDLHQESLWP